MVNLTFLCPSIISVDIFLQITRTCFYQPILLQPTVGFIGDGAFDKLMGKCHLNIVDTEVFFIFQVQFCHNLGAAHVAFHYGQQLSDFGGDFGGGDIHFLNGKPYNLLGDICSIF